MKQLKSRESLSMSETKIFITATITVEPKMFASLEPVLRDCADLSQKEAACLRYEVGADVQKVGRFVLSEIWENEAGFKAHLATAHFKKLGETLKKLSGVLDVIQTTPFSTMP
ncbi:antibiotic biosynthesis monooxygenase [Acetobacteraceae bacterium]|nr:antibiotic biosynthesis monooxygenase [Acetobacteraceae bacterium]